MDHSVNTLTAAMKSLTDTVSPAIDPEDPLAQQQLTMVTESLRFLQSRLPYLHTRARIELIGASKLARNVQDDIGQIDARLKRELSESLDRSASAIEDPASTTPELENAASELLALLREALRGSVHAPRDVYQRLASAVLEDSEAAEPFYRSWYLPLGLDPYPGEVPPLQDVLAESTR